MDLIIFFIRIFLLLLLVILSAVIVRRRLRRSGENEALLRAAASDPVSEAPAQPATRPSSTGGTQELESQLWYGEESTFIFKLNEKISLTMDRQAIADSIVDELSRFLNVQACVLFLEEEETGNLRIQAFRSPHAELLTDLVIRKSESISGYVLDKKEPLSINDLETNGYFNSLNREFYLKGSFVSAPLVVKGAAIGVLDVANKKTGDLFKQKDIDLVLNVARISAIAFQNARLHEQIQQDYLKTITTLALVLDARDPYTKRHSENVTRYSVAIAKEMKFSSSEVELIRRAGLLHDIGKIGIRDDVLLKPGKLTNEEFELIKTHPAKGYEIVSSLPFLKEVANLVRQHHERFDGKGYPDGKAGESIELGARILAVSDTFDAMTTDRPYRKHLSLDEARAELIRCRSTQFDPRAVDCFLEVLQKTPEILMQ